MTFQSTTGEQFQNARFALVIDGLPFIFCEEVDKITLDIWIKGDLNDAGEYMRAFVGTTQIGGDLASGFQDDVFRKVISDYDVTALINNNDILTLEAFGSAAVGALGGLTNSMRFDFKTPYGTLDQLQLDDVQLGNTITGYHLPRRYYAGLSRDALQVGAQSLDLDQLKQTGSSLSATIEDIDREEGGAWLSVLRLRNLMAKQNREKTFITASETATDGTLSISSGAALTYVRSFAFIGRETVFHQSRTATTLADCLRGIWGSTAQPHYGGAEVGPGVYEQPPTWTGRRGALWVAYKNENGDLADHGQLGAYRMDAAPSYDGADRFKLQFSDMADLFQNRQLYQNYRPAKPTAYPQETYNNTDLVKGYFYDDEADLLTKTSINTLAIVNIEKVTESQTLNTEKREEIKAILNYNIAGSSPAIATFSLPDILNAFDGVFNYGNAQTSLNITSTIKDAKQVFFITGDPSNAVLRLIESGAGAAANGTYDQLPGRVDPGGQGAFIYRFGADINSNDVDEASFLALQGTGLPWNMIIMDPLTLGDVLKWFCISKRAFWCVDETGKIGVKKYHLKQQRDALTGSTSAATKVIDSSLILSQTQDSASVSETATPQISAKTNYSLDGSASVELNMTDAILQSLYPENDRKTEFDLPFTQIADDQITTSEMMPMAVSPLSLNELESFLRSIQKTSARGFVQVRAVCAWPAAIVNIGDQITFTNDSNYNFKGTTYQAAPMLVTGKELDVNSGTVALDLVTVQPSKIIGAGGEIFSFNSGTNTIRFDASDPEWNGNDPTSYFAVGAVIKVVDQSAANSDFTTVTAIVNATDMTIAGVGGFTPAGGDLVLSGDYDNATTATILGPTPKNDYVFQCVAGVLGASNDDGTRWN